MILRDAESRMLGDLPVVTSLACWVCVLVPTCMTTHTHKHTRKASVSLDFGSLWKGCLSEDLAALLVDNHLDDLGFLESLWAS